MSPEMVMNRALKLRDRERLALFRRAPELGPKVLFFSGGTALKSLSQKIIDYTHNSIHILTPFDSGGSSAVLRQAFDMLAVGDLRNRIMALADTSLRGNPYIFELFAKRLSKAADQEILRRQLEHLLRDQDEAMRPVPSPVRHIILNYLRIFYENMPGNFDLRGACIGNLILAGGFLAFDRHIDPVIYMFSKFVESRGDVCAVTNRNLHLLSRLQDGTILAGQHMITGKEVQPIHSPIQRVHLIESLDKHKPVTVELRNKVRQRILSAQLICYPMGSFYSSLMVNLLPKGVGQAIAASVRPKIYIPNSGHDPEQLGLSLADCVDVLIHYLKKSCLQSVHTSDLLNYVLLDTKNGDYAINRNDLQRIIRLGVEVLDVELVTEQSHPYLDAQLVIEHLLSFC